MGDFLLELHLFKALAYYKKAREIESNNIAYIQNMAICYQEIGEYKNSAALFQTSFRELESNNPLLNHNYGQLLIFMGNFKEARSYIEKSVKIQPKNILFNQSMGVVEYHLENYEKAIAILEKVIKRTDNQPLARLFLGHSYIQKNNYRAAVKNLAQYVQIIEY